jgi:hypothetical protein
VKIYRHRRHTANHTWHLDVSGRSLFIKANPHPREARAEVVGHGRLQGHYPVPSLRARLPLPGWTILAYDRWPHLGTDSGLLLDVITEAEQAGDYTDLDALLDDVLGHYFAVIKSTIRPTSPDQTVGKLYGQRAARRGRLDAYYGDDRPLPVPDLDGESGVRPSRLADLDLDVNGTVRRLDLRSIVHDLRRHFSESQPVWAALTQGDPTDFNIGWSREGGPVWFDYDTAGSNALAGEFANFLLYQRLHGPWLTPHYNPDAYTDHPTARAARAQADHAMSIRLQDNGIRIEYRLAPSHARRRVMTRYLDELVLPIATMLEIDDVAAWLRPYLLMRLLAVYDLTRLGPLDAGLSLGLVSDTLEPLDLRRFLALDASEEKAT